MIDPDRQFRYDICRTVGHETTVDSFVCSRCEYNIIGKVLEERLSIQFVGRKITADTAYHFRDAAVNILAAAIRDESIDTFASADVQITPMGRLQLDVDIQFPCDSRYVHLTMTC